METMVLLDHVDDEGTVGYIYYMQEKIYGTAQTAYT